MRHRKKGRKLGTSPAHTKAIKKNLTAALLANDRIKTTMPRAKEIRGQVDRVITWAKRGDVHSRRLAIAKVGDKEIVREIFEKVDQGMFAGRNGGYTRIIRLGHRKGDNAEMVIIELVTEAVPNAPVEDKKDKKEKKERKPRGKAAEKQAEEELVEKFKFKDDAADIVDDAEEAVEEAEAEVEEFVEEVAEEAAEDVAEAEEVVEEVAEAEAEAEETVEEVAEEAAEDVAEAEEAAEEATEE